MNDLSKIANALNRLRELMRTNMEECKRCAGFSAQSALQADEWELRFRQLSTMHMALIAPKQINQAWQKAGHDLDAARHSTTDLDRLHMATTVLTCDDDTLFRFKMFMGGE